VGAFNHELEREHVDAARLEGLRRRLGKAVPGIVNEWQSGN
jgi:hypothetical protein